MSIYGDELVAARRQGREAYESMEEWVSRPLDAPGVSGAVLEGLAKELRSSRDRLQELLSVHGIRDDIAEALVENEGYHRALGLTVRDVPDREPPEEETADE